MSLILADFDLMAWTVEDLILSRSNSEVLEFRSCSELDDRWKICSKSIKHISIEPEGYDYDRGINRTVLVDSPNVSSFSFNAGSFDKSAVKNGSSPYELRKLWFKIMQVSSTHTAESIILCVGSKTLRANAPKSTCESSYFPSASVCKQASTNEQNSGENLCFEGVGDGSYKICQTQNFSCKTTARM
ncbi:hypothetical protein FF1_023392 [Malus domestica]